VLTVQAAVINFSGRTPAWWMRSLAASYPTAM
jgi:hypothetical protein